MPTTSKKLSFCFVSETRRGHEPILDPSVRYRCFHPAEALRERGHQVAVYSAAQFRQTPNLDFDVYTFHRPNIFNYESTKLFTVLEGMGRILIADYDDLIFGDPSTALISSGVKNQTMTPSEAVNAFSENFESLLIFNRFTVSTEPLAQAVKTLQATARVIVSPNTLPQSLLELCEIGQVHKKTWRPFRLGYFSGTRSHNLDFKEIDDVIYRSLCEDHNNNFLVVGPVDLSHNLLSHPRVHTIDIVGYYRLPWIMSACETVIAPLEQTMFNNCKSRVKYLEASVSGCRLIASPIDDMVKLGTHRVTLCKNKDDWYCAITDHDFDTGSTSSDNYSYVRTHCGADLSAQKLIELSE